MTDIHIPPEALEKGAREIAKECPPGWFDTCLQQGGCLCREQAAAAFRAIVEGWPGMMPLVDGLDHFPRIVLPLEASNG